MRRGDQQRLTGNTDYKTDNIIQNSLRKELNKDVTLITIAHRLHTIMDYDKIVCLLSKLLSSDCFKLFLWHRWCWKLETL